MDVAPQVEEPEDAAETTESGAERNGPRIYGVIDVVRADRIAGWAIDRSDSAAALDVEILRQGVVVRTVRADRHRADLEKGGIGTGAYGFRADIEPPLEPGLEFTVTAWARSPDGARGELKRVGPAVRSTDPSVRLLERIFEEVSKPDVAPVSAEAVASRAEIDRLTEIINRVEVAQARLEVALGAIEPVKPPAADGGLRMIVATALCVALVSLGVGLYSLFLA